MTIAELFVSIGVKGGAVTGKALSGIKDKLGEISESSLATKAAILGVIVGLERLTGFASQAGMELNKFATLTGGSTQELQKWQYALGRFDVSGQETQSTLTQLQAQMAQMKLTGQAPAGLNFLANTVGFDPKKADDMFYVMGQLQKLVKTQPPAIANQIAKSFGLSENMIQGLRLMNLEKDKLSKKDLITKAEEQRLTEINKTWKDIWFTLERIGIKLVAGNGLGAVQHVLGAVKLLRDGFVLVMQAADKIGSYLGKAKGIVIALGIAVAMAFAPIMPTLIAINVLIGGIIALLGDIQKFREGKDSVIGDIVNSGPMKKAMSFFGGDKGMSDLAVGGGAAPKAPWETPSVAPNMPTTADQSKTSAYNVNNVFHIDGSDASAKDIATESSTMIDRTFRQMAAQKGGQ